MAEAADFEADFENTSLEHYEPGEMPQIEQDENAETRIDRVQRLVNSVWFSMFHEACPRVVLFGSRDYGLATASSDWDYALEIHDHLSAHAKVFRAKFRQCLCERGLAKWMETEDQLKLNTLKWKFKDDKVQSSLNVSSSASMALARATTSFLKTFYLQHKGAQESIKQVASMLRGNKHMVTGGVVGETLKSAALYLWCAPFIAGRDDVVSSEELFQFLARFTADTVAVEIDLDNHAVRRVQRAGSWKQDALVVRQLSRAGRRNAASKVTEVSLASLQNFCCAEGRVQSVLFEQVRCEHFVCSDVPTITRHNVSRGTVVSCIAPSVGYDVKVWRVLVVLTGNGNDRCIDFGAGCTYKYVVTVSWQGDHTQPVEWLPSYLENLRDAISAQVPQGLLKGVDLLGLSRGHMALMACCESRRSDIHLRLAAQYRHFMAAGGCIWQARDPSVVSRILQGISEMSRARRSSKLFTMVVLARMDSATLWSGDVMIHTTKRKKDKIPRVLYAEHAQQITPYADVRVLNLGGHMHALKVACAWANYVCEHGKLPPMKADASASDLSTILSDIGRLHADSISTTRVIDEASWQFLFKRKGRRRRSPPLHPPSGHLGKAVLKKLRNFAVCTISGEPGVGKSRDTAPSLLGTLMNKISMASMGLH